jgi:hypothetical protein
MRATSKWLSTIGIPVTLGRITSRANLQLQWVLKQSCNLRQELSNGMSHIACTQGNRVDSWLLMVGSQTDSLTCDLSFGHNLCFRCPNGQCEPILDIYASITFQRYKELFKEMGFGPCNHVLKLQESIGTPTPNMGVPLGVWGFIPSHSLTLPGECDVIPKSFSWLATLQPLALVANLGREPKARVATSRVQ